MMTTALVLETTSTIRRAATWTTNARTGVRSRPLDPLVCDAVERAKKARHRLTACGDCLGPVEHDPRERSSRCLNCHRRERYVEADDVAVSFRRCELCGRQNMAGRRLQAKFCAGCAGLSAGHRTRRLRWKQESEKSTRKPPINIGRIEGAGSAPVG